MERNNLFFFEQEVDGTWGDDVIAKHILTVMDEIDRVYSIVVISDQKNTSKYIIRYAISETDRYNVIVKENVLKTVISSIKNDIEHDNKRIVGYLQPPIDLMVDLYEPLIHKLATKQHRYWQQIEYDDLCQICRMTLVLLYNKGYYIHKRLLEKAFNNEVLQEVKKISSDVKIISLETSENGDEDMEKLTLRDTICDLDQEYEKQDKIDREISFQIFTEVKELLTDIIGERQFEQLFRDYVNGHTSTWSRRKMQTIKALFEKEGLTRRSFNNKYGR